MAGSKRFASDFQRIDAVKPSDKLLIQDSEDGVVKFAYLNQIATGKGEGDGQGEQGGAVAIYEVAATYAELEQLVAEYKLVSGMRYRLTDYVTPDFSAEFKSAKHPFDLILTADSDHTFNRWASVTWSERDTEGVFANVALDAWRVMYVFDRSYNAENVEDWKGDIWTLKDDRGNIFEYDAYNLYKPNPEDPNGTTGYYTFTTKEGKNALLDGGNNIAGNHIRGMIGSVFFGTTSDVLDVNDNDIRYCTNCIIQTDLFRCNTVSNCSNLIMDLPVAVSSIFQTLARCSIFGTTEDFTGFVTNIYNVDVNLKYLFGGEYTIVTINSDNEVMYSRLSNMIINNDANPPM